VDRLLDLVGRFRREELRGASGIEVTEAMKLLSPPGLPADLNSMRSVIRECARILYPAPVPRRPAIDGRMPSA
jgi:hypothetical protein